jgi:hypothetical protein
MVKQTLNYISHHARIDLEKLPEGRGFTGCGPRPPRTTTPAPMAPPLLNQEGSYLKRTPPQMRMRGTPNDGVVLTRR